jgi:hypothetical protein
VGPVLISVCVEREYAWYGQFDLLSQGHTYYIVPSYNLSDSDYLEYLYINNLYEGQTK